MLNFSIKAVRIFLIIYMCTLMAGCGVINWWMGEDIKQIQENIDTNGDGKLSPEEIKLSKYDLNKDGLLSLEEMETATAGSDAPSTIMGILAGLNIPFAFGIKIALDKIKENKSHVRAMAGGIEDLVNMGKKGYTKEQIYTAIRASAERRGDALALHKMVIEIKDDIRNGGGHIIYNMKNLPPEKD